jgi:Fe-S cluster assembly protein SufD
MAPTFAPPLYQDLLDLFDARVAIDLPAGPAFLVQARQQAMAHFRGLGFPTTRTEDWKYTNLAPYLRDAYAPDGLPDADREASPDLWQAAAIPGLDCYQVRLLNGRLQPGADLELPPYIRIRPLAAAWQEPAFQECFGRQALPDQQPFAALNTALFRDGLFIEVDAEARLDKPLHLIHAYAGAANQLMQPRHLVVVRHRAALQLIESVVADNGEARLLVNGVTEIILEAHAQMQHYTLQQAKKGLVHLQHTEVGQMQSSLYSSYTFSLPGAELLRNNLHINLAAENTESHLYGFYLGAGHQLIDNHTLMNHRMPHCESNEIYKGVLLDTATGVFNGKVYVHPEAQKTNAFQQNNNLLLSPKAVIYSKPQLEIYADDVKCSHGSTTGQLNPEALFYLRSRGIGEDNARALLVQAFAFDVTEQVKIPKLKSYINQLINRQLPVNRPLVKT